jgi:hypothetical protein
MAAIKIAGASGDSAVSSPVYRWVSAAVDGDAGRVHEARRRRQCRSGTHQRSAVASTLTARANLRWA